MNQEHISPLSLHRANSPGKRVLKQSREGQHATENPANIIQHVITYIYRLQKLQMITYFLFKPVVEATDHLQSTHTLRSSPEIMKATCGIRQTSYNGN